MNEVRENKKDIVEMRVLLIKIMIEMKNIIEELEDDKMR